MGLHSGKVDNFGKGAAYFGIGALAGAASAAVGGGMSSAIGGGGFWAGAGGTSMCSASSCFVNGAAIGAAGGAASGLVNSSGNAWLEGASFGGGLRAGFIGGTRAGLFGGLAGGLAGGVSAMNNDCNFFTGKHNELLGEINQNLTFCPNEGSNDCFVKSAESIEQSYGPNQSTAREIRQAIGKTNNELVTVEDMEKVGYEFWEENDPFVAYLYLKDNRRAFHATDWGDRTGHITAVNKMQMFKRASGRVYFRLYTMDSARGQYVRTAIRKFYFIQSIESWK